jgi:anaerobic sulfite reductase subunit B
MATGTLTETAVPELSLAPRPFRVASRRRETADTWTLRLEPVVGPSITVSPGQFTMLYAFGIGEVPISVSGDRLGPLVHTVRAAGLVTQAVCASRPGAVLGVRGPFGNTWPVEGAGGGDVVIVAGGIGLAPLRPALLHVLRHRREYGRVSLLYGSRTPGELLFRRQLDTWGRRAGVDVDVTVDAGAPSWAGKVGVVPKLIAGARFDPRSTTALVCGPEIMMRFAARGLRERGVPDERIFLSMERNMRCGVGHCGHCQLGPTLICRDGPVYRYDEMEDLMTVRQL